MAERRLIVGRAGTGKTTRLLERYRALRAAAPLSDGLLLIVPTYSQVVHLRHLLTTGPEAIGLRDDTIVTFSSLAEAVCPDASLAGLLDPAERIELLRSVLDHTPLQDRADQPGFLQAMLAAHDTLREETPDAAAAWADLGDWSRRARPHLHPTYEAVGAALGRYSALLEERGLWDHARLMVAAGGAEAVPQIAHLLVDGFQELTAAQWRLLERLIAGAETVTATFTFDRNAAGPLFAPFTATEARWRGLDFQVEPQDRPWRWSAGAGPPRPGAALERALFTDRPAAGGPAAVEVWRLHDRWRQGEEVAAEIRRRHRDQGLPYHRIGICYRQGSPSLAPLTAALEEAEIPYRLYEGWPLGSEPLVRQLLSLGRAFSRFGTDADVEAALRLTAAPEDQAALSGLTTALRRWGWPGAPPRWPGFLERQDDPAVRGLADRLRVLAPADGESATAARMPEWYHRIASQVLLRFLPPAAAESELAGGRLTAALEGFLDLTRRLPRLLEPGADWEAGLTLLDRLTAGATFRPRNLRAQVVHLINLSEARQWELDLCFVLDAVQGTFPTVPAPDPFLPDAWITGRADAATGGTLLASEDRAAREPALFYTALTRARERTILTRPTTDATGRELLPAPYLARLLQVDPDLEEQDRTAPLPPLTPAGIVDWRTAEWSAARAGRDQAGGDALARGIEARRPGFLRRLASPARPPADGIDQALWGRRLPALLPHHSPSSLAAFAACPFQHFAGYLLRLREPEDRREAELPLNLQGTIIHEALERHFRDEEDPDAALADSFQRHTRGYPPSLLLTATRQALRRALHRFVTAERERLARAALQPQAQEWTFGGSAAADPAGPEERAPYLEWPGDGGTIRIKGTVDRIDEADREEERWGLALDYKYSGSHRRWSREGVAEGTDLQLPLYLLALARHRDLRPAGGLLGLLRETDPAWMLSGFIRADCQPLVGATGKGITVLEAATLDRLLETAEAHVRATDAAIQTGAMAVRPRDGVITCRVCAFPDLCRVDRR